MIIDLRKKSTALDLARKESKQVRKEVEKQFLYIGKVMSKWVDKYHDKTFYKK